MVRYSGSSEDVKHITINRMAYIRKFKGSRQVGSFRFKRSQREEHSGSSVCRDLFSLKDIKHYLNSIITRVAKWIIYDSVHCKSQCIEKIYFHDIR